MTLLTHTCTHAHTHARTHTQLLVRNVRLLSCFQTALNCADAAACSPFSLHRLLLLHETHRPCIVCGVTGDLVALFVDGEVVVLPQVEKLFDFSVQVV